MLANRRASELLAALWFLLWGLNGLGVPIPIVLLAMLALIVALLLAVGL